MIVFYLALVLTGVIAFVLFKQVIDVKKGRELAEARLSAMDIRRIPSPGAVNSLSILPLMDFYTGRPDLKTEPGVSYLITADATRILMDVGFNKKKEHPSPLLHNMASLGVSLSDLDMIFISHAHLDHLGGMQDQKEKTFSLSRGPVSIPDIPVYAPVKLSASKWNQGPKTKVITEPTVLKDGIISIGVIPRFLFLMGYTPEISLAVNVAGKGVVLIIGCGHQTIERIIERTQILFSEPIYAIIGGLHYPVKGGRIMLGPINIQRIVGSDKPPWKGIREADVESAISAIRKAAPKIVALSPHDSSDWTLERFRQAFGDRYVDLQVGREIVI